MLLTQVIKEHGITAEKNRKFIVILNDNYNCKTSNDSAQFDSIYQILNHTSFDELNACC